MDRKKSLEDLGSPLLTTAEPGAVTDYSLTRSFEHEKPNVHNAWTHAVPAMEAAAKSIGQKTIFGADKGKKTFGKCLEALEVVIQGMYADLLATPSSSPEEILRGMINSLVVFKTCYPNWDQAYSYGFSLFCKDRDSALDLVAFLQRRVNHKFFP